MAQFGRPDGDISLGTWAPFPVDPTTLFDKINEETPNNDTDYIYSDLDEDECEISLTDVDDPGVGTGHVIRCYAKSPSGSAAPEQMTVALVENGNVRGTSPATSVSRTAYELIEYTLSEAEANTIQNYANLRLRFHITKVNGGEPIQITQAEFECPDAGATPKSVSDLGSGADSVGVKVRVNLSDSGAGADVLAELKALLSLSESGSGIDVAKVGKSVSVSDVVIGGEVLSILSRLTVQDSGMGTDIIALIKALLGVSDSGIGIDGVSVGEQGMHKLIQDSGVGQESVVIKVLLSILDDALGSDSLVVRQFKTVLDAGEADEAIWDKAYISVQDSGLGSEALSILSKVKIQDVGLAVELLGILLKIDIQDLGIGVDKVSGMSVLKKVVSDSGVSDESVSKEVIELIAHIICLLESKLDIRAKLEEDLDIKGVLKE